MHTLAKSLYLMALIVWVGEVVFFSFVVAPAMFRTFSTLEAGRAVSALFPIYYRIGYVCGITLLILSVVVLPHTASRSWWSVNTILLAVMFAATVYAGAVVQPRAAALRPQIHEVAAPQAVKDEFNHLHRLAVSLNSAVLMCGVAVSVLTAARLRP